MMRLLSRVFVGLLACGFLPVAAQDLETVIREDADRDLDRDDWEVEAGLLAAAIQDFPGSKALQGMALPYFYLEYKDRWFAHPTSGVGYYFKNDGNEFISTSLTYLPGRQEDEAGFLNGLGDLDGGIAARAAAQFDMTYFVLGGFVTHQVTGDDTGTEATLYAATRIKPSENFRIFPTLRVAWADEERQQAFFGVTPEQAAASAFTAYTPDGGVRSYGLQLQALYDLNDRLRIASQASWDILQEDAADSPIVQSEDQYFLSLGLIRKFD
ncbi:MAG: MipA/OmpV family protein [Aquisalinus sp.]|nr:MipA/OmpV family protein [Aquisalinus sp.]